MKKITVSIEFDNNYFAQILFGGQNSHLKSIAKKFNVDIDTVGAQVIIKGIQEDVSIVSKILNSIYEQISKNNFEENELNRILLSTINEHIYMYKNSSDIEVLEKNDEIIIKTVKKTVKPFSPAQRAYMKAIYKHEMVFAAGPAGTGKTYLAVAAAVDMFLQNKVERIILARPALEAGEKIGFLPGEMKDKLDPYMRPLYDALYEMLPYEKVNRLIDSGVIEIAPLAFMRGRTLNNAFIILDEAQNCTATQMHMFLTRMGYYSRMVIAGDLSQTDLPGNVKSGFRDALEKLDKIEEIAKVYLDKADVVRHPLIIKIVESYEKHVSKWDKKN